MHVVRAIDGDLELDRHARKQVADEIHVAAVVFFEAVCLYERVEAHKIGLAAVNRIADVLLKRPD